MTTEFSLLCHRLETERKRLMEKLERLKTNLLPAGERREGSPFGKREEEATECFELEKHLVLEKGIKDRLAEVEHALAKFEKGTYGLCDSCGQFIDPARLEALPQASLCLSCKAHEEKGAKGGLIPQRERLVRYDEKVHILNFNVLDELVESVDDMADELEVRES